MTKYLLLLLLPFIGYSQKETLDQRLFASYDDYKEITIDKRRFKHNDIQPLIDSLKTQKAFEVTILGESIQERSISMISVGEGETDVLLWSQMHGDEPTATAAIFDIINYFKQNKTLLKNVRVHFIPMLNPDGAEAFSRRNAIGIDINRDAVRRQSPESEILKRVRDSLDADFGFNLHDQSKYYNAKTTEKPATISFLAPAYNFEKDINETRGNAMRVIANMNKVIQRYARGQVGRYSDEFEPRAFGDNMQLWGTSTILIESGGHYDDPEKQFIRKLNYVSILSAIESISTKSYEATTLDQYMSIPKNDRKLFDLKIENLSFSYLGLDFKVDIGVNHTEIENKNHSEFYYLGKISDVGDLSTHYGYETLDAEGYEFKVGETYPKILDDFEAFMNLDFTSLLSQGYTSVSINDMPKEIKFTPKPINIIDIKKIMIPKNNSMPMSPIKIGADATFLLMKNDIVVYAIINGFIYNLDENKNMVKNGLVK
ncbi:M14 family zinc carboxypeptidase [Lutimonas halocynthiae]|uniref:M14 family zinc carboxypeptidase n=1 Tax=Lutimonas halocynthiae TaxID=1446477 RepID=UPI0025B493AB|nr:M14 family zinc carboxypeptidase [Lutimonas halocynthiae]MDN3641625.1 M14 family zinc carboxypeptidase [Lutimonas halocynthiae]